MAGNALQENIVALTGPDDGRIRLGFSREALVRILSHLESAGKGYKSDLLAKDANETLEHLKTLTGVSLDDEAPLAEVKEEVTVIRGQRYRMVSRAQGEDRMNQPHNQDDVLFLNDRYYVKL